MRLTTTEIPVNELREMRRQSTMATARLEHAILQAVINHVAEEHLTQQQIVMALINVSAYWQKKIILNLITNERWREINGEPDAQDSSS